MGTASLTREQLNEAINEFADKIMEALGATVADEETTEPELTGTYFKVIGLNGEERVRDATLIDPGTLIKQDMFEIFRCGTGWGNSPWIRYNGCPLSHEEFAEEMRKGDTLPRIIHYG